MHSCSEYLYYHTSQAISDFKILKFIRVDLPKLFLTTSCDLNLPTVSRRSFIKLIKQQNRIGLRGLVQRWEIALNLRRTHVVEKTHHHADCLSQVPDTARMSLLVPSEEMVVLHTVGNDQTLPQMPYITSVVFCTVSRKAMISRMAPRWDPMSHLKLVPFIHLRKDKRGLLSVHIFFEVLNAPLKLFQSFSLSCSTHHVKL